MPVPIANDQYKSEIQNLKSLQSPQTLLPTAKPRGQRAGGVVLFGGKAAPIPAAVSGPDDGPLGGQTAASAGPLNCRRQLGADKAVAFRAIGESKGRPLDAKTIP